MYGSDFYLNNDFTAESYRTFGTTFAQPPVEGGTIITTINGASGPNVTFSGGTTGLSFAGAGNTITMSGTLVVANGGTGQSSYTKGDLLVGLNATTLSKLAIGANGSILTADSGEATGTKWAAAPPPADLSVVTTAIDYALSNADDVVLVDTAAGDVTVTLHDPATAKKKLYSIKMIVTGNDMILDGDGADIDASPTITTAVVFTAYTLIPDSGSGKWFIV